MEKAHWVLDPAAIPERTELPPGPVIVFGFHNWGPDRLNAFLDNASSQYGSCIRVPFNEIGLLRCV
jgi:hypothetical protein